MEKLSYSKQINQNEVEDYLVQCPKILSSFTDELWLKIAPKYFNCSCCLEGFMTNTTIEINSKSPMTNKTAPPMHRDLSNRGIDIFQRKIQTHHSVRFEHCDIKWRLIDETEPGASSVCHQSACVVTFPTRSSLTCSRRWSLSDEWHCSALCLAAGPFAGR